MWRTTARTIELNKTVSLSCRDRMNRECFVSTPKRDEYSRTARSQIPAHSAEGFSLRAISCDFVDRFGHPPLINAKQNSTPRV